MKSRGRTQVERSDAKEHERWKIEQFLKLMDYEVVGCKPSERPDFIFTMKKSGEEETSVIGIEHTDYYNDATPGQRSFGQLLYDFWGKIADIIESKIDKNSEFHNVSGYIRLNKDKLRLKAETVNKSEGNKLVDVIAEQLFDLVDEFLDSGREECSYCTYKRIPENMLEIPNRYHVLNEYFMQIDLQKVDLWQSIRYGWHANICASHVGLSASKLIEIVRDKQKKCQDYATDGADELWLLIAAPATTVYNATPHHPDVVKKLDNLELRDACASSGFDKVFFWSRSATPCALSKQIWPT